MRIRRFNADGVSAFARYRSELAIQPRLQPPLELLEDPAFTELIPSAVDIQSRSFANRLEAGKFFMEMVSSSNLSLPERDRGLWAWLTLFYFDQVCPPNGHGERDPQNDESRLIPSVDNFQRYYRHLLMGPFLIVRAQKDAPECAIAMLCNPLHVPGEIAEQLASRKELVTNHAVAEVATLLYYDRTTGSFKRGAGAKNRGGPRRLAALLNQLDLTYYLYGMTSKELLVLLPKEFDRFRDTVS